LKKILPLNQDRVSLNYTLVDMNVYGTVWISLEPKITAPLRETGRIAVNFTSRVFPTPLRESQADAEEQVCKHVC
jgi:hypothetical protein